MTTSLTPVTETARAKVNLCLHIVARREDGFHELDSLVAFAGIGDQLSFTPANHMSVTVDGPFASELSGGGDNLALIAADRMHRTWPNSVAPAAIGLTKNLPVAAGIGGGSADAAAVIRGLMRFGELSINQNEIAQLARGLGADVPVCLAPGTCRMGGVGETLRPVESLPQWDAVLVNPRRPVSTPAVFAALDLQRGEAAFEPMHDLPRSASREQWITWLSACRNDLQRPATQLVPDIATALAVFAGQAGCSISRMSGSGATCFGLFDDAGKAAAAQSNIAAAYPDWWVCRTVIG